MEAPDTILALPYVSKDGFAGPTVKSLLSGIGTCKVLLIGDQTQVAARNNACKEAIKGNFKYLWFVDSDQDFPPDALARLKAVDADVACADMWSRSWPSFRIVFDESGSVSDEVADRGGVENIRYCGMGCTLLKVEALKKMAEFYPDQPWFWTANNGEDATFCFKVLDMGGTVKCDFGLKSGHWSYCRMMGQPFTRDRANLWA